MIHMPLNRVFKEITREDLLKVAQARHEEGCRFVQMLCVATESGIDLVYSFMHEGEGRAYELENVQISGIDPKVDEIPSVTEYFLSAFPFENEAHDLFGVNITNIAIDFAGGFYKVAMDTPMTVISPAQKAAREKAAKIAAAKAAKEAAAKAAAEADAAGEGSAASPAAAKPAFDEEAERAKMEEKVANLDPEKAAKVRAAFEAKVKKMAEAAAAQAEEAKAQAKAATEEAQAAKKAELEEKLAGMDPEKAAKVRAAMEAKAARAAAEQKGGE